MKNLLASLFCACIAWLTPATAQDWPQRTVRIIAPFAPGSTPDIVARVLADRLSARLGKPFVVENKAGGAGMIGTDAVAKAVPDGHTIGVSITGPLVNNTVLYKKMAYDPFRDLAPVTLAVNQPCVLVAHNGFNASSFAEVVSELKRQPGKVNYASFGNGSNAHLSMELIAARSQTKLTQVPYPGSPQAVAALIRGDVSLGCMPAISVMPHVKAGRLKAIGVASAKRSSMLPEIPTLQEQGLDGVEANSWVGVIAPAQTPKPVLVRIHAEIAAILHQPEVVQTFRAQMMEAVGNTPEEFAAYLRDELRRWAPVIKANNISLD